MEEYKKKSFKKEYEKECAIGIIKNNSRIEISPKNMNIRNGKISFKNIKPIQKIEIKRKEVEILKEFAENGLQIHSILL